MLCSVFQPLLDLGASFLCCSDEVLQRGAGQRGVLYLRVDLPALALERDSEAVFELGLRDGTAVVPPLVRACACSAP